MFKDPPTWAQDWQQGGAGAGPGETLKIPLNLPEESHGQRSLVGYNPWGRKELDTTERLSRADLQGGTGDFP